MYGINSPVKIDQFPILESNYLPGREDGQSAYGALKADFERHLEEAAPQGGTQAVALRLECPGVLSNSPINLFTSTSIENTVDGFARAIEAELPAPAQTFNLVDGRVRSEVADVQAFLLERWPDVPNHTQGNESLLSIERACSLLGYRPTDDGTYYPLQLIWG